MEPRLASPVPLNVPMRVGEVARLLGWNARRMRRLLDRLAEDNPTICVRVNGHRRVTLAALRKVWPDFAAHLGTSEDLSYLQNHMEEIDELLDAMAKRIGGLHSAVAAHTVALDKHATLIERLAESRTKQRLRLDGVIQNVRRLQAQ